MCKNKLLIFITLMLFVVSSLCSCNNAVYACDLLDNEYNANVNFTNGSIDGITINEKTFGLQYSESNISELTGNTIDEYKVISGDMSDSHIHVVRLDRNTGEMVFFMGITPYDEIANISELNEIQLKNVVEDLLKEEYDFSIYDEYVESRAVIDNQYTLRWSMSTQNVSLAVYVSKDGTITCISKTDAYSNAVMTMSIDDDERDSLIINKLIDENIIESKDIDLDILSARQSLYQGKDAMIYVVKLTDPQGYTVVHTLAVYNS